MTRELKLKSTMQHTRFYAFMFHGILCFLSDFFARLLRGGSKGCFRKILSLKKIEINTIMYKEEENALPWNAKLTTKHLTKV